MNTLPNNIKMINETRLTIDTDTYMDDKCNSKEFTPESKETELETE